MDRLAARDEIPNKEPPPIMHQSTPTKSSASPRFHFPPEHVFGWQEVVDIIRSGQVEHLRRTPLQIQDYHQWMQDCCSRYRETSDYIRHVIFGHPVSWTDQWMHAHPPSVPSLGNAPQTTQIILRMNDFPYSLQPNVVHYCLWSNVDLSGDAVDAYLRQSFVEHHSDGRVCWFQNPPHLKSIKDIWHVHVFLHLLDS